MRHGCVLAALVLLLAGCGGGATSSGGAGNGGGGAGGAQASCPSGKVAVPDVVGGDHQAGQDELLAVRFVDVKEVDASGKDRPIDLDSDWTDVKVVPAAGTCADPNKPVTLYAKKDAE
jgi:hypothetical protein